jgi:hypothetical protein
LCRFAEALGGVPEHAETGKEEVDSLTESQRKFPGGHEEKKIVDVR